MDSLFLRNHNQHFSLVPPLSPSHHCTSFPSFYLISRSEKKYQALERRALHTHSSVKEPNLLLALPHRATCKAENEVAQIPASSPACLWPLLELEHHSLFKEWEQTKLKS